MDWLKGVARLFNNEEMNQKTFRSILVELSNHVMYQGRMIVHEPLKLSNLDGMVEDLWSMYHGSGLDQVALTQTELMKRLAVYPPTRTRDIYCIRQQVVGKQIPMLLGPVTSQEVENWFVGVTARMRRPVFENEIVDELNSALNRRWIVPQQLDGIVAASQSNQITSAVCSLKRETAIDHFTWRLKSASKQELSSILGRIEKSPKKQVVKKRRVRHPLSHEKVSSSKNGSCSWSTDC